MMEHALLDPRRQFERDVVDAMPKLKKQLQALCGDTDRAEDLTQETVTRAIAAWQSFEPDSNLGAWLYTIGKNHFLSLYRKIDKREVEDSGEQSIAETTAVLGNQVSTSELQELAQAVDKLPEHMQGAVRMVAVMGYSYEQAAQEIGCEIGTVKSRVNRARVMLSAYSDKSETAEIDQSDRKEVAAFLYELAKHYLAENDGDVNAASDALTQRLLTDKLAMQEVSRAAIVAVAKSVSSKVVRHRRERIINRAEAGRGAVIALAAGISAALLDMPLTGGAKLRRATRELVLEEADRALILARKQHHKAKWLRLIAQSIPNGKCVGDVLTDQRAQELWDEAKK